MNLQLKWGKKIQGWNGKLMSFSGKTIFIKAVLYSISMHILTATNPPRTTLQLIEKQCSNFLQANTEGGKKYHRYSWTSLCLEKKEGGARFRSIHDINKAFAAKAWWSLRTTFSLWREFMEAKYCNKSHPVKATWKPSHSQIWRKLMDIKDDAEKHILSRLKNGEASFWWDKWSEQGPLANLIGHKKCLLKSLTL